jgi:hypothetical protein
VNDIDDVLLQARDSLSGIHMDTPAEAILARSRSHQRRRRHVKLSVAGIAAGGALALGLTGVFGSGSSAPAPAAGTIRTAAFTLVRSTNGTATLTLNQDEVFNPTALQQALAEDGIPALVQNGTYCSSNPAPPSDGVLSLQLPDGNPVPWTGRNSPVPPDAVTVINPAAMPAGTELNFTYVDNNRTLLFGLIYDNAHSCSTVPDEPAP